MTAKITVRVTPPILDYPGPHDTVAGVLNRAARNLDNRYDVGGSGVRRIVAQLLREVGDQIGEVNMANPLSSIAAPSGQPNIGDTCCGQCPADTCYVDQVTGA